MMRKLTACAFLLGFIGCSTEGPGDAAGGGTANARAGSSTSGSPALSGAGGAPAAGGASGGSSGAGAGAGAGGKVSGGASGSGMSGASGGAPAGAGNGAELPAELLDLTNFKLTLPIGEPETPTEIKQPELASYEQEPYFWFDAAKQAVVFQAPAGGVTTSGSDYPRCELREMTGGGAENAAWSMTDGTHSMTIRQAITQLPVVKAHVVAGQIHDGEDDVVMIRLEGEHLFVEGGGEELGDLNPSYQLGTEFTVRIVASAGMIRVFYDDLTLPKVEVPSQATDCYFKAGVYTQSNPERGDEPTAYGEVAIYELEVTHE
jgi:hypothetical protein